MPLWLIYHPPSAFADNASKQALAKAITANYTDYGLPAFYVDVNFIKLPASDLFVGGEPVANRSKPFIRISVDHIHVTLPKIDKAYVIATDRIDKLLKPHIQDKGYDWEYHVDETDRRLWKINGLNPPPWKSDDEKVWSNENRAVPPGDMAAAGKRLSKL